jgi:hypothetical protein
MRNPRLLLLGALVVLGASVSAFLQWNEHPNGPVPPPVKEAAAPTPTVPASPAISATPAQPPPPGTRSEPAPVKQFEVASADPAAQPAAIAPAVAPARKQYQPGLSKFKNAQDPQARLALSGVGSDTTAELRWIAAINDPNLPAKERKDLIEDLNEDGLSDPSHPAPRDLPVIESRLHLIEQLLPSAIDQTNADAFREAQKDLIKMRDALKEK